MKLYLTLQIDEHAIRFYTATRTAEAAEISARRHNAIVVELPIYVDYSHRSFTDYDIVP